MSEIRYFDPLSGKETVLDFSDLVGFVKGASITSLAISDDFLELGLSDSYNLSFATSNLITLMPTTNKREESPVRLIIAEDYESATAELIESRLHAVRQIYAINFLIDAGREDDLRKILILQQPFDLESVLKEEDKLVIMSASTGSFWLTLAAKSGAAWKILTQIAPLFLEESRQLIVERVRAETEMKKLNVEEKRLHVGMQKIDAMISINNKIEKIKDPTMREQVREELIKNIGASGVTLPALPSPGPRA